MIIAINSSVVLSQEMPDERSDILFSKKFLSRISFSKMCFFSARSGSTTPTLGPVLFWQVRTMRRRRFIGQGSYHGGSVIRIDPPAKCHAAAETPGSRMPCRRESVIEAAAKRSIIQRLKPRSHRAEVRVVLHPANDGSAAALCPRAGSCAALNILLR